MKLFVKNPLAYISLILAALAILLPVTAYLGYRNNLGNVEQMLNSKGLSLLEAVLHESENSLIAEREINDLLTGRLADNCRYILHLQNKNLLDKTDLLEFTQKSDVSRFDLYSPSRKLIKSSDPTSAPGRLPDIFLQNNLLDGSFLTYIRQPSRNNHGSKQDKEYFALALSSETQYACIAYLETERLTQLRRRFGIGLILEDIAAVAGVEYAALQDSLGIIAASHGVTTLSSITSDSFFPVPPGKTRTRYVDYNGNLIYEVASVFQLGGEDFGHLRIGFSTEEIDLITARDRQRFLFGIIMLAVLLSIVAVLYIAGRRQLKLEQEHSRIKSIAQSVLEGMSEAVIVTDKKLRIILLNGACKNLCGCPEQQAPPNNLQNINPVLAQTVLRMEKDQQTAAELKLQRADGSLIPVLISSSPINIGGETMVTIILSDLSDRIKAEQLALQTQKYKTMAEVSAGVAHEIRNPLNAIGMNVQRLKLEFSPEKESKEEYDAFIGTIRSEVERLNSIVEQFLHLARFPEPKMQVSNINALLEETLEFYRPEIIGKGIKLEAQVEKASPFLFDPGQIRQVVNNLVANAVDAMDNSGILTVRGYADAQSYFFIISDTGNGIPAENTERIFEPFFSTKGGGMGLGLAIAARIINEHGGTISVENGSISGAVFTISIPIKNKSD